jgi:hypothetical protein
MIRSLPATLLRRQEHGQWAAEQCEDLSSRPPLKKKEAPGFLHMLKIDEQAYSQGADVRIFAGNGHLSMII